jgi:elongator complex protein 2
MSKQEKIEQETRNVGGLDWNQPPLEGQLADHTIWPETKKVFAHNYDIVAITLSTSGKILASSCKARNSQSAGINTWDTGSMLSIQNLMIHESTVVCLKFSHNDKYLASSGKDRALCIFKLDENTSNMYELCVALGNSHKRIVWDLCWSGDSSFLVSVSRDGFCKIWTIELDQNTSKYMLNCIASFSPLEKIAVTAIDILPNKIGEDKWLTVIGLENGDLLLYYIGLSKVEYLVKMEKYYSHGATVKKIRFRPNDSNEKTYWFATCSEDFSVRIFNLIL